MPKPLVKDLVHMGLALKFDVAEWDLLPLNHHPQDRLWENSRPFAIAIVLEQGSKSFNCSVVPRS